LRPSDASTWVAARFQELHAAIAGINGEAAPRIGVNDTIVIVDAPTAVLYDLSDWNPLREQPPLNPLSVILSLLILALPEVQWAFIDTEFVTLCHLGFADGHLAGTSRSIGRLFDLHDSGYTTLFDPAGLREWIRQRIAQSSEESILVAAHIPLRKHLSASIDDEAAYGFFTAYAAYRFGYRSFLVVTASFFERLFRKPCSVSNDVHLLLEDVYLRFTGHRPRIHASDLLQRDAEYEGLTSAPYRVFITVGQKQGISESTWRSNQEYMRQRSSEGQLVRVVSKPLAGIFDVWNRSGLMRLLRLGSRRGFAPGFVWPPETPSAQTPTMPHSAPSRLRLLADTMISRVGGCLESSRSVSDAVRAALVSLDAAEYVGSLTPTTAFDALIWKHECEVQAECLFTGVQYNIDVDTRLAEVHREIEVIGQNLGKSRRRFSTLNAEASVVSRLAMRFRTFDQFDEDQACMTRLRSLYRHIWFNRRRSWAWIVYPARWYVDCLLDSMWMFAAVLILWLCVLAVGYAAAAHTIEWAGLWEGLNDALAAFVGVSPVHTDPNRATPLSIGVLNIAAAFLGFVHLGIFVSHVYSLMARK
jgi:hypothetical protein